jgi:hypothetical protein
MLILRKERFMKNNIDNIAYFINLLFLLIMGFSASNAGLTANNWQLWVIGVCACSLFSLGRICEYNRNK